VATKTVSFATIKTGNPSKRTAIGNSPNTRPTNKHRRKGYKAYRGQGK